MIRVIIIGGGACGMAAATKIRRQSDFEITVLSRDSHTAYSHCGIPFVFGREIENFEKLVVKPPDFFRKNRISLQLNTEVREIDLDSQNVRTGDGTYPFDKLVIAVGSLPFVPRKSRANILPCGVHTLRSLADGIRFGKTLEKAGKVCIIGGGTIGIECAAALAGRGISTILVSRSINLLSRQFDPDMATFVREYLETLGVEVISGRNVIFPEEFWKKKTVYLGDTIDKERKEGDAAYEESEEGKNEEGKSGKKKIPTDLVLLASGAKPEIDLARAAGIDVGEAGGIIVNERLQVRADGKFLPGVYAGGECAEVTDFITGKPRLSQLGTTARRMADVIGDNVTGTEASFGPLTDPWVAVAGGLQFGGVGLSSRQAEEQGIGVITGFSRGRTRASYYPGRKDLYIKLLFREEQLVGAQLVGGEGVKERIDTLALAIRKKTTIRELLELETCYAPPVSMLVDPLHPAVKAAFKKMQENEA
ncbi:TPA: FAD-dependent oxidoreductase [Methanosarcinaceae archaeon]|nr:FAD-dependent oxidoreductase [Methanosarcinaceae archaeon]